MAALFVPVILWVIVRGGWAFRLYVEIVVVLGAWEFFRLVGRGGGAPRPVWGIPLTAALGCSFWFLPPGAWKVTLPLTLLTLGLLLRPVWVSGGERPALPPGGPTVVGALYVGGLFAHQVALREVAGISAGTPGWSYLLLVYLVIWASDTASYFVGRGWGRHRLLPRVSPGKTWEGAVGGLLGGLLVTALFARVLPRALPMGQALALGGLVALAGQVGDLAESALKRACGAKDSSGLLPGHGGILDRYDGLLFATPVAYYYLVLVTSVPQTP